MIRQAAYWTGALTEGARMVWPHVRDVAACLAAIGLWALALYLASA